MATKNNNNKRAIRDATRQTLRREAEAVRKASRDVLSPLGEAYMKCIVDPMSAKPTGVPTIIGGVPGRTRIVRSQMSNTFEVGASGFGWIMVNPGLGQTGSGATETYGGFNGNRIAAFSDNTFAGVTPVATCWSFARFAVERSVRRCSN